MTAAVMGSCASAIPAVAESRGFLVEVATPDVMSSRGGRDYYQLKTTTTTRAFNKTGREEQVGRGLQRGSPAAAPIAVGSGSIPGTEGDTFESASTTTTFAGPEAATTAAPSQVLHLRLDGTSVQQLPQEGEAVKQLLRQLVS